MGRALIDAFTDMPQDDWSNELVAAKFGPVHFIWDADGKGRWHHERLAAPDYATYSDGTPPDPVPTDAEIRRFREGALGLRLAGQKDMAGEEWEDVTHENAGDRAARKTAELRARSQMREHPPGFIEFAMSGELPPVNGYHGFRDPPEPAPNVWKPKLDRLGVWSCYALAACILGLAVSRFFS